MSSRPDTASLLPLSPAVFHILVSLADGDRHGYAIIQDVTARTGGEVRLGFPGARQQTVSFTDGRSLAQARDLAEAARLYAAGWELGSPGRPGLRVHFPGTRQERLADPEEVYARPADAVENHS